MDPDSRVAFTEIKGDVKLILAGQDRTNSDLKEVRNGMSGLDKRVGSLEAKEHQRTGAVGAVKFLWAMGGVTVMGVAAFIARSMGL